MFLGFAAVASTRWARSLHLAIGLAAPVPRNTSTKNAVSSSRAATPGVPSVSETSSQPVACGRGSQRALAFYSHLQSRDREGAVN